MMFAIFHNKLHIFCIIHFVVRESLDVSQKNFNQRLFKVNYDATVITLQDIHLKRLVLLDLEIDHTILG